MICSADLHIFWVPQVHHLIALKEDAESRMRREEPDAQLGSTTTRMQQPITTNDAVVDMFFPGNREFKKGPTKSFSCHVCQEQHAPKFFFQKTESVNGLYDL